MKNVFPKRPCRRGFTLVELLVVIAIIGVLMAILLPALGRARAASTRVVCASNMRQIALATANYAAAFRGYLPPYVGYDNAPTREYSVSNSYNKDNLKRLFDTKMLTTDKVRYCPTGPAGDLFGGRANYQFNPHNAKQPTAAPGLGKDTWRYKKLQEMPKDRALLVDVIYDSPNVSHFDKKIASWNVCFADGRVSIVQQNDVFNMIKGGRPGNTWGRLNDYVRVLELQAFGMDPKLGKGSYQWNNYDPTPTDVRP